MLPRVVILPKEPAVCVVDQLPCRSPRRDTMFAKCASEGLSPVMLRRLPFHVDGNLMPFHLGGNLVQHVAPHGETSCHSEYLLSLPTFIISAHKGSPRIDDGSLTKTAK